MSFAFGAKSAELGTLEYFDDEVAARLEIAPGDFKSAAGVVDGTVMVGALMPHGGIHHVREDNVEGFIAHKVSDPIGGFISERIALNGVDTVIPEFVLFSCRLQVYADDEPTVLFGAEILAGNLQPGTGGAAEIKDVVALSNEFTPVLDFFEFESGAGGVAEPFGFLEVVVVNVAYGSAHSLLF